MKRSIRRNLKLEVLGKRTIQYSIPLTKDNPFQEEDFIYILKSDELQKLLDEINQYKELKSSEKSDSKNYKLNELEALTICHQERRV